MGIYLYSQAIARAADRREHTHLPKGRRLKCCTDMLTKTLPGLLFQERLMPLSRGTFFRLLSRGLFQERKLAIVTCRHLFPKGSPGAGLNFEVTYIDEAGPSGSADAGRPVVLMLPGAPGGYIDFKDQIPDLVNYGARVIAPNFPDMPALLQHRSPKCKNTPENKEAMIRDFLEAIGVSKIEMLVSHSSAVYTGLRLFCYPSKLKITSYAMINPLGHWHTTTRPGWFFIPLGALVNYPWGYQFLKVAGMYFLPYVSPVKVPHIDAPLVGLTAIRSFDMKEVKENLLRLSASKKRALLVFSDNDRLIQKRVSHEMLQILGSERRDWWLYDAQGQLQLKGREDGWLRVLNFARGSHYSMRKHPHVLSRVLVDHLERAMKDSSENRQRE